MSKYLINADFRIMMKGQAVVESKIADDFVYDTENEEGLSAAQMKEIAKANGFKLKGKKVKDIRSSFEEQLNKLKLPEKRKMTDSENVSKIVAEGHEAGNSEDEILIAIVQSGIKFQAAIKMMKNAMIELGFSVTQKERYQKSKDIMEDDEFEPEEYAEVVAMAKELMEKIGGTSEAQALAQIRKYCKEFEVAMPKKVKEKKTPLPIRIMAWIAKNVEEETKGALEALEEWLEELGVSKKVIKTWKDKFEIVQKEYNILIEGDGE